MTQPRSLIRSQDMYWWQWTRPRQGVRAALIVSALMGASLLGDIVAAGHDGCHDADDQFCPICLYIKTSRCLPESAPPLLPITAVRQRLALLPVSQPSSIPMFATPARGPPPQTL